MKNLIAILLLLSTMVSCDVQMQAETETKSSSGASRLITQVETDSKGHTAEQLSVESKIKRENVIGGIQYVYILSAYSGEIITQSVAQGKVSSSGKRLTPAMVTSGTYGTQYGSGVVGGMEVSINGATYHTPEVMGDDGTYGSSCEYLYWTDTEGVFHRQYITGGILIHVSDKPMRFGHVTITTENGK